MHKPIQMGMELSLLEKPNAAPAAEPGSRCLKENYVDLTSAPVWDRGGCKGAAQTQGVLPLFWEQVAPKCGIFLLKSIPTQGPATQNPKAWIREKSLGKQGILFSLLDLFGR